MNGHRITRSIALYGVLFLTLTLVIIAMDHDVASGETWYVDDSGGANFTTIQEAVDVAADGDEIKVAEGSYEENVVINVSITLTGSGPERSIVDANAEGSTIHILVDGVNIYGLTITGSGPNDAGVLIESEKNLMSQVNCSDNGKGILILGKGNNTITNSVFKDNRNGIEIKNDNNSISESTFSGNDICISVVGSFNGPFVNNNTIRNNSMIFNMIGIQCSYSSNNWISGNNVSSNTNSGIYLLYSSSTIVRNNIILANRWNGIYLILSHDIKAHNNSCSQSDKGISLSGTNNVTISENTIQDNKYGIYLMSNSHNITANFNMISGNSEFGLDFNLNGDNWIDAKNNWWGNDHGPYNPQMNPNGKGDNITEQVEFDPWTGKEHTVKYVDDDAPDGGNGTMAHPYNKIQDAVDNVEDEGIVYVWEGTYEEGVLIDKPLIVVGNGSSSTIIDGGGTKTPITIQADHVNVSGILCTNSGSKSEQGGIVLYSDHNHIFDVVASNNGGDGIGLYRSHFNSIHGNSFSWNEASGGSLDNSSENVLFNNSFTSNMNTGLRLINSPSNEFTTINCSKNEDGLRILTSSHNNTVERSTFSHNNDHGLFINNISDITVRDSVIIGNYNGVAVTGSSSNIVFTYNSIENNSAHELNAAGISGDVVNAIDNWWGSSLGPYSPDRNPDGTGGNISHGVIFEPWLMNGGNHIIYVGKDMPDGGDGSREYPYNDVQGALDNASDGEIVRVLKGYYFFELHASGYFVEKSLHIIGSGIENTILDSHNTLDHQDFFHLTADGCSVTGFTFRFCSPHHELAAIGLYSNNNRIYGNYFTQNNNGIYISSSSHNMIYNNTFYRNYNEIRFGPGGNNYNMIVNNTFTDLISFGIRVDGSYNTILGNTFSNSSTISVWMDNNIVQGNQFLKTSGMSVKGNNNTVLENSFISCTNLGIIGEDHTIRDNSFINNSVGIQLLESSRTSIITNYFQSNGIGLYHFKSTAGNVIQYNIFRDNGNGIMIMENSTGSRINYNRIFNNSEYGIMIMENVVEVIDAKFNWWGDENGPYHSANNSNGSGDNVTDSVDFSSWFQVIEPVVEIKGISVNPSLQGIEIEFSGIGHHLEQITRFVWYSSIDGILYDGSESNYRTDLLSIGTHIISFKAQGQDDLWSQEVTISLTVVMKPIAEIESGYPFPDPALDNETVRFKGNGSASGSITLYHWTSDLDGELYNGTDPVIDLNNLSFGNHTISLRIMDDLGFWSDEVLTFVEITDRPIATIDQISPNSSVAGTDIDFIGNATSVDLIILYSWYSDLDGLLYSGNERSFSYSGLSNGLHIISLSSMNSNGIWSFPVAGTVLVHGIPEVKISNITPDQAYINDEILFNASGSDDGAIVRYVWTSSISGLLYDGKESEFFYKLNKEGTHIISLSVQDDQGAWGNATPFTIDIMKFPIATIVSISPAIIIEKDIVLFTGKDEQHLVRHVWDSNIDGELYNGSEWEFESGSLSNGTHTISLRVVDHQGTWSDAVTRIVKVNGIPRARIELNSSTSIVVNEMVSLRVISIDDGAIQNHRWQSSLDGLLYLGPSDSYETSSLSVGLHTIILNVMDNKGLWSENATMVLEILPEVIPNQKPTVNILSPTNYRKVESELLLTGTASDTDGNIESVELSIDGGDWIIVNGSGNWNFLIDTSGFNDGNHTLAVRAYDGEDHSESIYLEFRIEREHDQDDILPGIEDDGDDDSKILVGMIFIVFLIGLIGSLFLPWGRFLK